MNKLLLISVVLATVVLPLTASRDRHPRRALKRALLYTIAFNGFYLLALRYVLPRL